MAAELSDQWKQTKTHLVFGLGVKWSLVFGAMIFKEIWAAGSKTSRTYLVEPHQFGVLREDKQIELDVTPGLRPRPQRRVER